MIGPLKSVTYVSRARPDLTDDDVYKIYRYAMTSNALQGITGLLVYDGTTFLQIVEGGEEALLALFVRLRRDDRHQKVVIVDDRDIGVRSFGTWSMHLLRVDRAHMTGVASADELMGPGVQPEIRAMLSSMIDRMGDLAE